MSSKLIFAEFFWVTFLPRGVRLMTPEKAPKTAFSCSVTIALTETLVLDGGWYKSSQVESRKPVWSAECHYNMCT